jgi:hypothetical protein
MKRSSAPSVLAARKKLELEAAGIETSPAVVVSAGMPGHDDSAFDQFIYVLEKFMKRQAKDAVIEEEESETEALVPEKPDDECYYFAVVYTARQSSRHFDAAAAAESCGEGM